MRRAWGSTDYELQSISNFNPKVLFYHTPLDVLLKKKNTAGTRRRPRSYWLSAVSLRRMTIFAAITSWCWGYEHGASEELLTVHRHSVIRDMPADSVSSPSRDWVSRIFDHVTMHRPGTPHPPPPPPLLSLSCRSTWGFFVFPHHHFHGHGAVCFSDWVFSPHTGDTSRLQVTEVRCFEGWTGCSGLFVLCVMSLCVHEIRTNYGGLVKRLFVDPVVQHCREHRCVNGAVV